MARDKVTENHPESNRLPSPSRGHSYISAQEFVRGYITPIFERTPERTRFLVAYFDQKNRIISHQTLAISHPPKRRIDLKRCLSLGKKPAGAVRCAFVHNHPGESDPQWSEQDTAVTTLLFSLAYDYGLDLVDHILWGAEFFKSAFMKGRREGGVLYLCRGWEDQKIYASIKGRKSHGRLS